MPRYKIQNSPPPEVSIVVAVYNEEEVLPDLFTRLYTSMDGYGRSYEVIFVDDGSKDRSPALLRQQYQRRSDVTRVVYLKANAGQHSALLAGFELSRGRRLVTLDADQQKPPEEISKLLDKMDEGYDYVGTIRRKRNDSSWRDVASRLMNRLRDHLTKIKITDQGCMLRAYDRDIITAILDSHEVTTFIPFLPYVYAGNPTEVVVKHEERAAGKSKYSLFSLIQLNFDLVTSFSVVPLHTFSLIGMAVALGSLLFVVFLAVRRLIVGPEAEGVFTLFAIMFFLIGLMLFGIGLLGEYLGRLYIQVRQRPRYLIRSILASEKPSRSARKTPQASRSKRSDKADEMVS